MEPDVLVTGRGRVLIVETDGPTIVARGATSTTVTATCSGNGAEFPSCGWPWRTFTTTLRLAPGSRRRFYATFAATADAARQTPRTHGEPRD